MAEGTPVHCIITAHGARASVAIPEPWAESAPALAAAHGHSPTATATIVSVMHAAAAEPYYCKRRYICNTGLLG